MPRPPQQYDLPNVKPAPTKKTAHKLFESGANPELPGFIRRYATRYDPATDRYGAPAFEADIQVGKSDYLYNLHPYWSKKNPDAIATYVRHYLPKGGVVLDPFCGSGTTGLGATLAGASAMLIDASPSAGFLAYHYSLFSSPHEVDEAFDSASTTLRSLERSYETQCDRCGGAAVTEYVVWSDRYECGVCGQHVPLGLCPEVRLAIRSKGSPTTEIKKRRVCFYCVSSGKTPSADMIITPRSTRHKPIPIAISYTCLGSCKPKRGRRGATSAATRARRIFEEVDIPKATTRYVVRTWKSGLNSAKVPRETLYFKNTLDRYGIDVAADFYSARNSKILDEALSHFQRHEIRGFSPLLFFTGIMHKTSQLMACNSDGVGRVTKGTYYIAPIRLEVRPSKYVAEAYGDIRRHYQAKAALPTPPGETIITVGDSREVLARHLPDHSVDYIFTDPPYAGKGQYGELNFLWEIALGFDRTWTQNEVVVNRYRGFDVDLWDSRLRAVLLECFRVLKPNRWASICFHDTDADSWVRLQNALLDLGFQIGSVTVLDPVQKSLKQITAEKVVKSDLVVNCLKPRSQLHREGENRSEDGAIGVRVREILIETLSKTAGQDRNRLWDIVLKRLLARGRLAEHRFDEILSTVALRSESGRWFLREEFERLSQSDIKNEEDAGCSIERFARLRSMGVAAELAVHIAIDRPTLAGPETDEGQVEEYITTHLIDDLATKKKFKLSGRLKGVEFYDCLFFYLTRFLKGRPAGKTPRRNLADFLEEYLVRFKDGERWLYRPPDRSEAETLRKSRRTGLSRRIRQYVAFLKGEGEFPREKMPDAKTMLAWLKYCSTFGLADEGVLLYEKGGLQLQPGTDDYYDADEYYRNCKRKASKLEDEDDEADDDAGAEEVQE